MVDKDRNALTWKRTLIVTAAWLAYVLAAHQILLHRHDMFVVRMPLWQALSVEILLGFAVAILVMMVIRAPQLNSRNAALIFLWITLVVIGHYLAFVEEMNAEEILAMMKLDQGMASLLLVAFVYALLIAIPFVPGLELGVAIIMLFDWQGTLIVYLATVAGLMLAYLAGQHLPFLARRESFQQQRDLLIEKLGPRVLKFRYLALALLLNLPGNSVLGGGGGIALACGLSRKYSLGGYLLTILIATSPIPIMLAFGIMSLDQLFQ